MRGLRNSCLIGSCNRMSHRNLGFIGSSRGIYILQHKVQLNDSMESPDLAELDPLCGLRVCSDLRKSSYLCRNRNQSQLSQVRLPLPGRFVLHRVIGRGYEFTTSSSVSSQLAVVPCSSGPGACEVEATAVRRSGLRDWALGLGFGVWGLGFERGVGC